MSKNLPEIAHDRCVEQIGLAFFGQTGMTLTEIANRREEISGLRRDAERYRFIRDADRSDDKLRYDEIMTYSVGTLDDAIDAAMGEQQ